MLGTTTGCASAGLAWAEDERQRLDRGVAEGLDIVIHGRPDAGTLRRRGRHVPAGADLSSLAEQMEASMRRAKGVGLAAPQVGLSIRAAVLLLDFRTPSPRLVFAINPRILQRSDKTTQRYEGCLSIPDVGGLVRRNEWVKIGYQSPESIVAGDPGEIIAEAEGWNAVLWQHELDHLDGELYTDRLLGELLPSEEMRKRRKEMETEDKSATTSADPWRGFRA